MESWGDAKYLIDKTNNQHYFIKITKQEVKMIYEVKLKSDSDTIKVTVEANSKRDAINEANELRQGYVAIEAKELTQ